MWRVSSDQSNPFEDRAFLTFVVFATIAMAWIVMPFFGAILWGLVAAIVFSSVNDLILLKLRGRKNTAAGLTLLLIIAIVIIPLIMIGSLLVDQALDTFNRLQSRQIDFGQAIADIRNALPGWAQGLLDRFGVGDLDALQNKLDSVATSAARIGAAQAVNIGSGAFNFVISLGVMLYLTYFLLRDGRGLTRRIGEAIPMRADTRRDLFEKFTTVIRATVKGSIVVAIIQGMLGGIVFGLLGIEAALLWGVVMGVLSLVPAIGTGLIWVPVAIYLFATGSIWQGAVLVGAGIFVIGMVDNILRPILVGKDTRMPDYVVLIASLGGIAVVGINGFIVGPVIAAMFIAAWGIFRMELQEAKVEALEPPPAP
jgi:predicted PurR-regulated permease PerM